MWQAKGLRPDAGTMLYRSPRTSFTILAISASMSTFEPFAGVWLFWVRPVPEKVFFSR